MKTTIEILEGGCILVRLIPMPKKINTYSLEQLLAAKKKAMAEEAEQNVAGTKHPSAVIEGAAP